MKKTEWAAWAAAAFFFFGGDILTTLVGMQMGFVEMNPLNHLLFGLVGPLPGLITVKAIVLAVALVLFFGPGRLSFDSHRIAVPGVLLIGGLLITGLNAWVIMS